MTRLPRRQHSIINSTCHDLAPALPSYPSRLLSPTPRPKILLCNQTRSPCDDIAAGQNTLASPARSSRIAPPLRTTSARSTATRNEPHDYSSCTFIAHTSRKHVLLLHMRDTQYVVAARRAMVTRLTTAQPSTRSSRALSTLQYNAKTAATSPVE